MTDTAGALSLLAAGELIVEGRIVSASNVTLRCRAVGESGEVGCVYKPIAGERPLWDFPDGTLAIREVASHVLAEAVGWRLVPPTVLRDGPYGPGMCQLWVDNAGANLVDVVEPSQVPDGWLRAFEGVDTEGRPVVLAHSDDPRLRRLALFDLVANNADRKAGHVLVGAGGPLYGVDHGLTFHADDKVRTVLWGWSHQAFTASELADLRRLEAALAAGLGESLRALLTGDEVAAIAGRVGTLIAEGRFPAIDGRSRPIPWPVY